MRVLQSDVLNVQWWLVACRYGYRSGWSRGAWRWRSGPIWPLCGSTPSRCIARRLRGARRSARVVCSERANECAIDTYAPETVGGVGLQSPCKGAFAIYHGQAVYIRPCCKYSLVAIVC